MVLWQAVFLPASPLVTAPPSNLTPLYYDGSAAKFHSTTTQYRQLCRLNVMLLIDNTARKVPIARIYVDTPYLKGHVEAQCLSDPIYDLIVGNVPDARDAQNPDPS